MAKSNKHAGQFNLKGKKTFKLNCRCCTCDNLKDKIEKRRIERDVKLGIS